jgi:TolB-like protein
VESLLSSDDEARSAFLELQPTQVTFSAGTKLADYEVRSLVGSGGMGVVYRARDLRLGRDVAIKVLPPFFSSDRNRLRRFEQEARAAAALNHPNILAVYQLGTYEGSPYLVSELLEGKTLRARVKRGSIPLPEAMDYARQIARGLAAAHEKGIVHRDLKPENLFLTRDGHLKILDFGLAKQTRRDLAETKSAMPGTEAGVVMGTVGYMSPEQVRGQAVDFRADIFAFGAILYEMVAGKRAFAGESSADVASAILKENPPRLSRLITSVPKALESIVERCLEKNPEQRFPSAEELSVVLRGIEVSSVRGGASVWRTWPRLRSHWRLATAAIFLVAAAVAVFASVLYFRGRESTIDSIAVMPFASKGADPGSELGDGVAAGLIDSLSQIPNLRVMSRNAVSHYKGQEIDPQKVGRELNVRAVITGGLTQRGNGLVLDAELVNTKDDRHLWGQQYATRPEDVLTLQSDLARAISDKLRPRLASETKSKLVYQGTSNPQAYALYVKGRYAADRWDVQDMKKALAYFQQAVENDPAYPQAYAGVGDTYALLYGIFGLSGSSVTMPTAEAIPKARAAAHRALELDANLAEGHCAMGLAAYIDWQWLEAENETQRCLELNPSLSIGHQYHAWVMGSTGKVDQYLAEQKLAVQLDPISFVSNFFLVRCYYLLRNYDRAIEEMGKIAEMEPGVPGLHDFLANSYLMKGEYDKAALQFEEELRLEGKAEQAEALRRAYVRNGYRGLLLAQNELWKDPTKPQDYDPYDVAGNYALLGERENAFLWLDKAYALHSNMLAIQVDPAFDNIRSDPRYNALLRRMGFPP